MLLVDTASDARTTLSETFASESDFSVIAHGKRVAYISQTLDRPSNVWVLTHGAAPDCLTTVNLQVQGRRLGQIKGVRWKNKKDGRTVYGLIILPPFFKPGVALPTMVQLHGGHQWVWWTGLQGSWHEWGQMLASHGFVVLPPNPSGSTSQSWLPTEGLREDLGGSSTAFEDIIEGVDDLGAQKAADPTRLGIGSISYGGFFTVWAGAHSAEAAASLRRCRLQGKAVAKDRPGPWLPTSHQAATRRSPGETNPARLPRSPLGRGANAFVAESVSQALGEF